MTSIADATAPGDARRPSPRLGARADVDRDLARALSDKTGSLRAEVAADPATGGRCSLSSVPAVPIRWVAS